MKKGAILCNDSPYAQKHGTSVQECDQCGWTHPLPQKAETMMPHGINKLAMQEEMVGAFPFFKA